MWRSFAFGLSLATVPLAPLAAQSEDSPASVTPEEAIEQEHQEYGPQAPPPPVNCDAASAPGEIVVCARKRVDNARYRVKSTAELDPKSRQNLYDGVPRAPDVFGIPPCTGVCVKMGSVPPPVLMIDLKAIPKPPAGSDADKISKGEMAAP
jgi:hypothetical protein